MDSYIYIRENFLTRLLGKKKDEKPKVELVGDFYDKYEPLARQFKDDPDYLLLGFENYFTVKQFKFRFFAEIAPYPTYPGKPSTIKKTAVRDITKMWDYIIEAEKTPNNYHDNIFYGAKKETLELRIDIIYDHKYTNHFLDDIKPEINHFIEKLKVEFGLNTTFIDTLTFVIT